jgi:hypothetical protein
MLLRPAWSKNAVRAEVYAVVKIDDTRCLEGFMQASWHASSGHAEHYYYHLGRGTLLYSTT